MDSAGVQAASFHILHDDPEIGPDQEAVNVVDDVLVLGCLHDEDLVDNEVLQGDDKHVRELVTNKRR